jgi:hypothetical protein
MIGVLVCFAFTLGFILVLGPRFDANQRRDRLAIDHPHHNPRRNARRARARTRKASGRPSGSGTNV